MQGVGGDHRVGQVEGVQQWCEGGDLVALVGDLALGEDVSGVGHGGQQGDGRRGGGARAAYGLAVPGDRLQPGPGGGIAGSEEGADRGVQRVTVQTGQQPAHGARVRHRDPAGQRVGREAQGSQRPARSVGEPFTDRGQRPCTGQDARRGGRQQRDQRVQAAPATPRVGYEGQVVVQAHGIGNGRGGFSAGQLVQRAGHGR